MKSKMIELMRKNANPSNTWLMHKDAFDIMKEFEDNSIDLVVTDPPYFVTQYKWDKGDFVKFTIDWVREVERILKPGGTLWSFMGYEQHYVFHNILKDYLIRDLTNDIVWARQKGRSSSKHLKSLREDVYYSYKEGTNPIWNPLKMIREVIAPYMVDGRPRGWFINDEGKRVRWTGLGNVQIYSAPNWSSKGDRQVHPTQKPIMLLDRLIRLSSNPGDIVLDPFMGSGSTGVACLLSGRNFIGIEKDYDYYMKASERILNFDESIYENYSVKLKEEN